MWALLSRIPNLLSPIIQTISGINFEAITSFFQQLLTSLIKYWQYWLIALLVSLLALCGVSLNDTKTKLVKEQIAHTNDITNFKNAQAQAEAQAAQDKVILQKESKADADQADAAYTTLYAKYHAVLLRYTSQASASGTQSTVDNQLQSAKGSNGPSEGPNISITMSDAQICAENTARLQAVHDWAITLPEDQPKQ